jgi:hypothetical protein
MKYILDVDASKVIEAVRSTGVTITPAMRHYAHVICSGLKSTGMWQNSIAIYGFLGGTAASHKFNWKDLRDVNAAYRLTFQSGVSHNSLGIIGDGTANGFCDTYINAFTNLGFNSNHISLYSSTSNSTAGTMNEWGARDTTNTGNSYTFTIGFSNLILYDSPRRVAAANTNSKGMFIGSRTSSTLNNIFKDGNLLASNTAVNNFQLPSEFNLTLLKANNVGATSTSTRRVPFTSIGAGLTNEQAISSSQIITQAQNILNRA